jgi:hypothetical protein
VIFFDGEWKKLGTKETLRRDVSGCTGIPVGILSGEDDLEMYSIAQRMSWAAKRKTSRIEDHAYCLLGIFGINMPLIYGERETAFIRLQEEIIKISDDHTLFARKHADNRGGLLATSPASFASFRNIVQSIASPIDVGNLPPLAGRMVEPHRLEGCARGVHFILALMKSVGKCRCHWKLIT